MSFNAQPPPKRYVLGLEDYWRKVMAARATRASAGHDMGGIPLTDEDRLRHVETEVAQGDHRDTPSTVVGAEFKDFRTRWKTVVALMRECKAAVCNAFQASIVERFVNNPVTELDTKLSNLHTNALKATRQKIADVVEKHGSASFDKNTCELKDSQGQLIAVFPKPVKRKVAEVLGPELARHAKVKRVRRPRWARTQASNANISNANTSNANSASGIVHDDNGEESDNSDDDEDNSDEDDENSDDDDNNSDVDDHKNHGENYFSTSSEIGGQPGAGPSAQYQHQGYTASMDSQNSIDNHQAHNHSMNSQRFIAHHHGNQVGGPAGVGSSNQSQHHDHTVHGGQFPASGQAWGEELGPQQINNTLDAGLQGPPPNTLLPNTTLPDGPFSNSPHPIAPHPNSFHPNSPHPNSPHSNDQYHGQQAVSGPGFQNEAYLNYFVVDGDLYEI
ncbi:hypothetical protein N0V85_008238 [Neurospora sp. IMI 360204]|nr:hypothetical protein N0V85_008238 [Neurospora sp. IMI 360204]